MNALKSLLARTAPDDPERVRRRAAVQDDFYLFCRTYLAHIFTADFCAMHREIIDALTDPARRRIVLAAPRGHGKTNLVYVAYALWAMLTGRERFILAVGPSAGMAEEQLNTIKTELEHNDALIADFGDQRTAVWRLDNLELRCGAKIVARGAGASIRGMVKRGQRPTLAILDDLEKDQLVGSKILRDKLERWIRRVILPLSRDVKLFYIGTILHRDSVLNRFLDTYAGKDGWLVRRYSAILPDGSPLWPAYWSVEALALKRAEIGEAAFSAEYKNEPLADSDKVFRVTSLAYWHELPPGLETICAVDPATGTAKGDYIGLVVLGRATGDGRIYVAEALALRCTDLELTERLVAMHRRWRFKRILFEDLAFQAVYKRTVAQEAARRGVALPITGVRPRAAKDLRIRSMAPLVENGVLVFHRSQTEMMLELEEYPQAVNDDVLDALEYGVTDMLGATAEGHALGQHRTPMLGVGQMLNQARSLFRGWGT